MYYVTETDGTARFFDVSHDGLEDAIEFANSIGEDVCRKVLPNASGRSTRAARPSPTSRGTASTPTRRLMLMRSPVPDSAPMRTTAATTTTTTAGKPSSFRIYVSKK